MYIKTNSYFQNKILHKCDEGINIGDYVYIVDGGKHYSSYTNAFRYFWGDTYHASSLYDRGKEIWKVINIAAHSSNPSSLLYHIRNIKGENAVIGRNGIMVANFHKRNRKPIKEIVIKQLTYDGRDIEHDWRDKLWDFYENGKIVKRKIVKKEKH